MRRANLDGPTTGTMHAARLIAPLLLLPLLSCTDGPVVALAPEAPDRTMAVRLTRSMGSAKPELLDLDLIQRTCALYVAVRSSAWDGPIAFGRDIDDSMVHWNLCPGGNMVACVKTPSAAGDTIITGIPLPYQPALRH